MTHLWKTSWYGFGNAIWLVAIHQVILNNIHRYRMDWMPHAFNFIHHFELSFFTWTLIKDVILRLFFSFLLLLHNDIITALHIHRLRAMILLAWVVTGELIDVVFHEVFFVDFIIAHLSLLLYNLLLLLRLFLALPWLQQVTITRLLTIWYLSNRLHHIWSKYHVLKLILLNRVWVLKYSYVIWLHLVWMVDWRWLHLLGSRDVTWYLGMTYSSNVMLRWKRMIILLGKICVLHPVGILRLGVLILHILIARWNLLPSCKDLILGSVETWIALII